jgi:hypothetical protein
MDFPLLISSIHLPAHYREGGTCVRLDVLSGGIPDRIEGNRLVGVGSVGAPLRVFRSTLQGFLNQSIVGLSPLSESA